MHFTLLLSLAALLFIGAVLALMQPLSIAGPMNISFEEYIGTALILFGAFVIVVASWKSKTNCWIWAAYLILMGGVLFAIVRYSVANHPPSEGRADPGNMIPPSDYSMILANGLAIILVVVGLGVPLLVSVIRNNKRIMMTSPNSYLRFGLRRFQAAFWMSMLAVSVQYLLFLIPGIVNGRWRGEMGGFFVLPAIILLCAIIGCGVIIWINGFEFIRFISLLIYTLIGKNRHSFEAWDRVFCMSLWTLPWAFGLGAIVYILYFAIGLGGWPDDMIVGTIGNILGAFCYVTVFYNWFRFLQHSPANESEQADDKQSLTGSGFDA